MHALVRLALVMILIAATVRPCTADTVGDFLALIDRPRVEAEAQVGEPGAPDAGGIVEIPFSIATEAGVRMPGLLVKRKDSEGRLPVVISLHGTGGNMRSTMEFVRRLAERGFLGVVVDGPHHGSRADERGGSAAYQDAIYNAWKDPDDDARRHPFFFDTVWDVMRLVDWLVTREDVDAERIGLYGVSKGGVETYLTAAVDERITAAAPAIGAQSFRWALENDAWQSRIETIQTAYDRALADAGAEAGAEFTRAFYGRVCPGIDGKFDGPEMLPLICPRPLMIINGDSDPRTPMDGVEECILTTEAEYQVIYAGDKFRIHIQPDTGHKVTTEAEAAAIDWFVEWLGP